MTYRWVKFLCYGSEILLLIGILTFGVAIWCIIVFAFFLFFRQSWKAISSLTSNKNSGPILLLIVDGEARRPRKTSVISSTLRTETPAGHISIKPYSTKLSHRWDLSMMVVSKATPLSFGTINLSSPAVVVRFLSWYPVRYSCLSVSRSCLPALVRIAALFSCIILLGTTLASCIQPA